MSRKTTSKTLAFITGTAMGTLALSACATAPGQSRYADASCAPMACAPIRVAPACCNAPPIMTIPAPVYQPAPIPIHSVPEPPATTYTPPTPVAPQPYYPPAPPVVTGYPEPPVPLPRPIPKKK